MQTRKLSDTRTRTASLRVAAAVLLAATLVLLFISAPSWAQADDTAVSNLALSSTSPGEIAIAWDAPSRAPGDYRVTWKKSSGNWPSYKNANTANGGNAFPAGSSHTVSGMEEGTAYSVRVRARYLNSQDKVEESGPWTDSLQVTVASTPPPPATPEPTTPPSKGQGEGGGDDNSQPRSTNPPAKPQNLLAAAMHNSVSLFWDNPNDDSITGYQILRGPDAANLTVLTNDTGDKNTSYTDDTVTAETTYVYAVRARNANGPERPVRCHHRQHPRSAGRARERPGDRRRGLHAGREGAGYDRHLQRNRRRLNLGRLHDQHHHQVTCLCRGRHSGLERPTHHQDRSGQDSSRRGIDQRR